MVEKLEELVKLQTEVIKNLKIDIITVWDSGNNEKGTSTANFMSNMIKTLPPLHDVAKLAGLNLPDYLGSVEGESSPEKEEIKSSETNEETGI
jgi:flotillin